jgi:hypothetical protein
MQSVSSSMINERLYGAKDHDWHGEYLSLVGPCSMEADPSVFNAPVLCLDGSMAHEMEHSNIDDSAMLRDCEAIVPSYCSEAAECSDCSSIISSLSYQSFGDGCPGEAGAIPANLSMMEDDEGTPMAIFECVDFPPRHLESNLVSVVSLGGTTQLTSDDSILDGPGMDDDTLSFVSSASIIGREALRGVTMLYLPSAPRVPRRDCFLDIPNELVSSISSFLDLESLFQFRLVSKRSRLIASKDESGWRQVCQSVWSKKAFVLKEARLLYQSREAMRAFQLSIYDAQHRDELRPEELCFDPGTGEGVVWDFRFKETAGANWTAFDPWWTGGKARKMVFLINGTVKQIIQTEGSSTFTLYPPFRDMHHEATQRIEGHTEASLSHLEMRWRFVDQPMDLPKRPSGSYLRLTADGRDVPTYVVRRSRTGDWGFVIESCWGVYSSTSLPRRQLLDTPPPIRRTRMGLRRTRDGARWLNVEGIESDSEDEWESSTRTARTRNADSSFSMSTRSQWREALLYNYGATSLPEGEHAEAEFDRVWSQSILGQNRIPNY